MTGRRIVLDANILIRAVLGRRVRELIEQYGEETTFFAPELAFNEAARHLPIIADNRGGDAGVLVGVLDELRRVVDSVSPDVTEPLEQAAMARIGSRDPDDWPIVAAALALACPIWTEDRDFFGVGVSTWTTAHVEVYLRGE
ncbi:MAG: PIN domain-containing protein [Arachnia sp.]